MIDVLVAGGGPAGLAAAVQARLAGLTAVVVEPRTAPVDKACGEGVMPGGVASLRALGVEPAGRELRGIRYVDGARRAEAPSATGRGWASAVPPSTTRCTSAPSASAYGSSPARSARCARRGTASPPPGSRHAG